MAGMRCCALALVVAAIVAAAEGYPYPVGLAAQPSVLRPSYGAVRAPYRRQFYDFTIQKADVRELTSGDLYLPPPPSRNIVPPPAPPSRIIVPPPPTPREPEPTTTSAPSSTTTSATTTTSTTTEPPMEKEKLQKKQSKGKPVSNAGKNPEAQPSNKDVEIFRVATPVTSRRPFQSSLLPYRIGLPVILPAASQREEVSNSLEEFGLRQGKAAEARADGEPRPLRLVTRVAVRRRGGVAIAGPGGTAAAGDGGVAVVGPGGVAYARPNVLSVVGPGARVVALPPGAVEPRAGDALPVGARVVAVGPTIYLHPADFDDAVNFP